MAAKKYAPHEGLFLKVFKDKENTKHFSDLIFSIRMGQKEFSAAKVYLLFEHKSSPESLVGLQVLRYMALQWKDMYDQGQIAGGKLPPIIPIVIYQGRGTWQARASFQELVFPPQYHHKAELPQYHLRATGQVGQAN
ncbi:MAG: Rpn family recombination-promoting nuclease/putative transposase [Desulfovermiculus sp.]|nr:Rpn family recombination-promoting nuclease/putative transposase [Desulfovermiculus sp.]